MFHFHSFPTTFMLRVSFSPAPEYVIVVLLESSFSDPRAAQNYCYCYYYCYTLQIADFLKGPILLGSNPILGINPFTFASTQLRSHQSIYVRINPFTFASIHVCVCVDGWGEGGGRGGGVGKKTQFKFQKFQIPARRRRIFFIISNFVVFWLLNFEWVGGRGERRRWGETKFKIQKNKIRRGGAVIWICWLLNFVFFWILASFWNHFRIIVASF